MKKEIIYTFEAREIIYTFEARDTRRVTSLLKQLHKTQNDVAKEIGYAVSEVNAQFNGKHKLSRPVQQWLEMHHFDLEPAPMSIDEALSLVEDREAKEVLEAAMKRLFEK